MKIEDVVILINDEIRAAENAIKSDQAILDDENHPNRARYFGITKTSIRLKTREVAGMRKVLLAIKLRCEADGLL